MKRLFALSIALLVFFACFPAAGRAADAKAKARAALALAAAKTALTADCGCAATGACPCGPDCPCPGCPVGCSCRSYAAAYARAVAEGRPLLTWVGPGFLPALCKPYADCVCCSVGTLEGCQGPCLVVAKPDGQGGLLWLATLPYQPLVSEVRAVLAPPAALAIPSEPFFREYAPAAMRPQPVQFFGGGFGGGRRGGSC